MPEEITLEILQHSIDELAKKGLDLDLKLYVTLALISFVCSIAGQYVGSYFKKRGETLATKSDLDEILNQIKATTKATEDVKSAVAHADWLEREWRTLRKIKLEEFIILTHEARHEAESTYRQYILKKEEESDTKSIEKLSAIQILYFPELEEETKKLSIALFKLYQLPLQKAINQGTLEINLEEYNDEHSALYKNITACLADIKIKSSEIMLKLFTETDN